MLICECYGVSEHQVRRAIQNGAQSLQQVRKACRAGSGCGGCTLKLKALLRESRDEDTQASGLPSLQESATALS